MEIEISTQLVAHVIMFVMLLGLINAEKAQKLLLEDIDDQKEMEDYYYYPAINNRGETLDIVRLNSATKLASSTIFKLTVGTVIATIYLLACLSLFAGVIKNRAHFILPWMIFDVVISFVINSILLVVGTHTLYERFGICNWLYCKLNFHNLFLISQILNSRNRVILCRLHGDGYVHVDGSFSISQYYPSNGEIA